MRQGSGAGVFRLAATLAFGAVILALSLTLSGCGEFFTPVNNNPGGGGSASFVYVTNAAGTLTEYSLTSGVLAQLSGSPVTLPVAGTSIVVAPNNAFLYVGTAEGVFLYTIGSDGTLTEGNNNTVVFLNQTIASPVVSSMVIDPTSSWLIMAYQGSTEIDALPLDPTTGLPTSTTAFTATSTFAVPAPGGPRLAITPSSATNPQIYVALGTGGTEAIGFNASATTGNGPFGSTGVGIKLKSANSSDTAVAIDPTSTYVFITEANIATTPTAGLLRVFKTADLTTDLSNEPATGIGPSAVLSDLTGAFVYVTNSTDGTISGYTFDTTTQTLTAVGTTPTEAAPVGIIEDNSKTYIIDVGSGANPNLWLYSFDSAGGGVLDVNSTTSTAATNPAVANGIAATH